VSVPHAPIDPLAHRPPEHGVDPIFPSRWSSRAMDGRPLERPELMRLLEAARWAPSAFNGQPWRFRYALNGGPHWDGFFTLLKESNQVWCAAAGALLVVLSRTVDDDGDPVTSHSLDTGAALQNLLLQGSRVGLVTHAMAGFDRDAARALLAVPDDLAVECMVAVGRPGPADRLPERLRAREVPSGRLPLSDLAAAGPAPI
jgi:nitroreductase